MTQQLTQQLEVALDANDKRTLKDIYKSLSETQAMEVSKWYAAREAARLMSNAAKVFGWQR